MWIRGRSRFVLFLALVSCASLAMSSASRAAIGAAPGDPQLRIDAVRIGW